MSNKTLDRLLAAVDGKDVPEAVVAAVNELLATKAPWYRALFGQGGEFSKTATFATLANVLVLAAYVMSWFQGTVLGPWTVPAFDVAASAALLAIANGTYVGNNVVKKMGEGGGE